jgi:hypothetical protein
MIVGKPMANPLDGFYCQECGFNVAADEDGLCQRCGLDTSTGESVREHCAAVGLHLVTAADKAVLESENAQFKRATGFGSFGDELLVCTAAERAALDAKAESAHAQFERYRELEYNQCTPEEREVLDAMAEFTDDDIETLQTAAHDGQLQHDRFVSLADAELARRGVHQ